jgi:hypothetical protein
MISIFVGYLLIGSLVASSLPNAIKRVVAISRDSYEEKYGKSMEYSESVSYWVVFSVLVVIWPGVIVTLLKKGDEWLNN